MTKAFLVNLSKTQQNLALAYVFAKDDLPNRFYNFHWSMSHLANKIIDKPYDKKLTNNLL